VTTRRFPPPRSIDELEAYFVVIDSAGQKLDSQQEGSHVIPRDDWRLKKPKREPRPGEPDSTKGII
jgi:hypothetical protein